MTVWSRVRRRADCGDPIRVGVLGAGYLARGLTHLLDRLDGFEPALIVNRTTEHGVDAYGFAGRAADDVVLALDGPTLRAALADRRPVVTPEVELAIEADELDVLVEATGAIDYGATSMMRALEAGRSVVSINAEVDATIGWLLHETAREFGGVYTICDGDQPGVLMRTIDQAHHMGLEVVAAVNCKRHLDRYQSTADSAPFAEHDGTSIAITVAAGDGTKMNIEQAVVANLAGLRPECRGMHGIRTTLEHALADVLASTSGAGIVDYTLGGDFGAGVFVIARAPEPDAVRTPLRFFKLGDGPEYLIFSPYSLVHFEMPRSIAEVVLDNEPLWRPAGPPVAEVVAIAKRRLVAGEHLDGIGGDCCYGQIDTRQRAEAFLPVTWTEHARLVSEIASDEPIPLDAVELDESAPIIALRNRQEKMLAELGA